MKRIVSLLLIAVALLGAGCALAGEALDTSEFVRLRMYILSDERPRYKEMLKAFNAMAREELNCELEVNFISWGEFSTRYSLLFSSGEEFDLVYVATWLGYADLAQRGAFLPLEDLLPIYCAESLGDQPEEAFLQSTVNGHVYAYSSNLRTYNSYGAIVRGDLMDKYDIPPIANMDDYAVYLDAIIKNEPRYTNPTGGMNDLLYDAIFIFGAGLYPLTGATGGIYYIDPGDPEHAVFPIWEWEGCRDMLMKLKDYADAGYWPRSILTITDSPRQLLLSGAAASRIHNIDSWVGDHAAVPGAWDMRYYNLIPEINYLSFMQDAMAVPATSKHPERALMLLDKLRSDERYYNYLAYGVEGIDYELDERGYVRTLNTDLFEPQPGTWGFRTERFNRFDASAPASYPQQLQMLEDAAVPNLFRAFSMDTALVKNEYAAMQSVYSQYYVPLSVGITNDIDADMAKLIAQAGAAGNDIIKAELQRQVDAFYALYGE